MSLSWFTTVKSFSKSIFLHVLLLGLLVFSIEFTPMPPKPTTQYNSVMPAEAIDAKQVEKELNKLKQAEQSKKDAETKRKQELEQKAKQAEQKRKNEEQKLKEIKQQQEKQKAEETLRLKKLKEEKDKAEQQRIEEEKKKQAAEEERKQIEQEKQRIEEEKQKAEAERIKLEEEKRKEAEKLKRLEEERKKREAEEALQKQMADEAEAERQAEEAAADATLSQKIVNELRNKVSRNFNKSGLETGLNCTLRIQMVPGGEVVGVSIAKSSGNDIFDTRAISAVKKAAPFSVVPNDIEQFERLKLRTVDFIFKP